MSDFLDKFPKIPYNISGNKPANYELATNIFFRFGFLRDVINNASAYEEYIIKENETPEILANKYYGNPEAYWLILYANDIYDPQYDWPLTQQNLVKYIETKYGSVANAQSQMHHYEKIVGRQVENSNEYFFSTYDVSYQSQSITILNVSTYNGHINSGDLIYQSQNEAFIDNNFTATVDSFSNSNNTMILTNVTGYYIDGATTYVNGPFPYPEINNFVGNQVFPDPTIPFDCYVNLPSEPTTIEYVINGKAVTEVIGRRAVTCYDYEVERNEKKRSVKLINKAYYRAILEEFGKITNSIPGYIRRMKP